MTDIVERLRDFDTKKYDACGICDEAAAEIEQLREQLRAVLLHVAEVRAQLNEKQQ